MEKDMTIKIKYSRTDKIVLGIGYTLLGLFVLAIIVPLVYVVLASFMDPTVLNNQGLSFNIKDWTIDAYRRVLENDMIWRGFFNSFLRQSQYLSQSWQRILCLKRNLSEENFSM